MFLLSLLPAVLYSCESAAEDPEPLLTRCLSDVLSADSHEAVRTLDIFIFRDDRFQKLDCYQRVDRMDDWTGTVVSGSGDRIMTVLANSPFGRQDWAALNSRSYLKEVVLRLEDERRDRPILSGEMHLAAGDGNRPSDEPLVLSPFTGEIRLNSISCDFTGKTYEGETISEVQVYLTNVNAECLVLEEAEASPRRIINAGGLRTEDLSGFVDPDIIRQEISEEIGRERIYPGISLLCYRNCHPEESPGTPYTRLVIEGKLSGQTYYWPISVNRDTGHEEGIRRGHRYIYDIEITGKGSDSPEVPVKSESITFSKKIRPWEEKEEYTVSF